MGKRESISVFGTDYDTPMEPLCAIISIFWI